MLEIHPSLLNKTIILITGFDSSQVHSQEKTLMESNHSFLCFTTSVDVDRLKHNTESSEVKTRKSGDYSDFWFQQSQILHGIWHTLRITHLPPSQANFCSIQGSRLN